MQRNINSSTSKRFATIVQAHHSLYIELLGDIFPKEHLLTHYATIMDELEPVVNTWSMCYEAKHLLFKKFNNIIPNRINLCYSLALRH